MRTSLTRLGIAFVVIVTGVSIQGCRTTISPVTGEPIRAYMTWEQEIQLGTATAPALVEQSGGLVQDAGAQAYLNRIGRELVQTVEPAIPELPWEFGLLETDVVNAFSLPGGKVYISRALASLLRSDAELAGVVGHEIGHVTARHGNQRISRQAIAMTPLLLAQATIDFFLPESDTTTDNVVRAAVPIIRMGSRAVTLRYNRAEELEADEIGMRYMARAGYDPRGHFKVLSLILEASGERGFRTALFDAHPAPAARVERAQQLLATSFANFVPPVGDGWFVDRYEAGMLSRIGAAHLRSASGFSPDRPESWCAHCAQAVAVQTDENIRAQLP